MKDRQPNKNQPEPSTWRDAGRACLGAFLVLLLWLLLGWICGAPRSLFEADVSGPLTAVIAIAALLASSYSVRATQGHIRSYRRILLVFDRLKERLLELGVDGPSGLGELRGKAARYVSYLRRELGVLSYCPLALVVLFGAATIAPGVGWVRGAVLFGMLSIATYMAEAVRTSHRIAETEDELLAEVEGLESELASLN